VCLFLCFIPVCPITTPVIYNNLVRRRENEEFISIDLFKPVCTHNSCSTVAMNSQKFSPTYEVGRGRFALVCILLPSETRYKMIGISNNQFTIKVLVRDVKQMPVRYVSCRKNSFQHAEVRTEVKRTSCPHVFLCRYRSLSLKQNVVLNRGILRSVKDVGK
jgi:hypothetical protein